MELEKRQTDKTKQIQSSSKKTCSMKQYKIRSTKAVVTFYKAFAKQIR